ncbi:uncharacterized protein PHALS_09690 [Plasmopara halstedii]|uniref:Uncharacterized protein n=1 Tax=Plasmopara halstedii TaxID=4781 RepID=A0A0P1AEF3_PLAHL|nr:uncharacterized protein PHALS_09690 [Plasmopara halstedii]CEG39444.1 hypothetical protein PHALS_09690 [Plasmopara halstedii]|eukprot:XP_024575813.1 hypothetical protein PHALS_09690 [Plasmopara halstedii]
MQRSGKALKASFRGSWVCRIKVNKKNVPDRDSYTHQSHHRGHVSRGIVQQLEHEREWTFDFNVALKNKNKKGLTQCL